ncbi:MAG: hypothetical protein IPF68_14350 [Bacteroidales bacterium]|nr:hypothetical protein [Bacteroidales bacterium]
MDVPKEDKLDIALRIVENLINNLYLIDLDANKHLDTIVNDYDTFKHLLVRKFVSVNKLKNQLKKYLEEIFEIKNKIICQILFQQIIDDINKGEIGIIAVGNLKKTHQLRIFQYNTLLRIKLKQHSTRGIVNCRCSAYSSGTVRIKSSCNLTGKCFEIGN